MASFEDTWNQPLSFDDLETLNVSAFLSKKELHQMVTIEKVEEPLKWERFYFPNNDLSKCYVLVESQSMKSLFNKEYLDIIIDEFEITYAWLVKSTNSLHPVLIFKTEDIIRIPLAPYLPYEFKGGFP